MLTPDERSKAEAIMRRVRQRQAAIDADPHLSPEGKRAARAREQLAAEAAHGQLIEASDTRHRRAARDAHYKVFGLKADAADAVLADRDARQFATGLKTPADALKALAAAELRGDTSMAVAIAERAWTERSADIGGHWEEVVRTYAQGNPARNRDLGALAELTDDNGSDRFYRNMPRPADLQRGSIEQLAASAGAPEGI